jgi:peptide-methionine (S)-S-oxide reductase
MQGGDIGTQYRSIIFCYSLSQKEAAKKSMIDHQKKIDNIICTEIVSDQFFYRAEEYHQDYLNKNNLGLCSL